VNPGAGNSRHWTSSQNCALAESCDVTRFDEQGMWWEDYTPPPKVHGERRVQNVSVPDTGWVPPRDFPNLSQVKLLGIDTETKDTELTERGPGAVRGAAHMVGVSLATEDRAWYFPMRHEYGQQTSYNMDPDKVLAFMRDVAKRERKEYVGANLLYDLEVLRAEGVVFPRSTRFHDVQFAEPLLDEEARTYALDVIAKKRLGEGKDTPALYQWCADSFGGIANDTQRKNIYRAPPSLVGPYAESDATLPFRLLEVQRKELDAQRLTNVYDMECALIPLLIDMRFRGVRIDSAKAQKTLTWLTEQAQLAQKQIPYIDVWSNESLASAFDKDGLEYTRTEAGNPSFTKEWLEHCGYPLADSILKVRMYEKAANPFVESYILQNQYNGRVHCQFNPLRSDKYGTVSGRFSSSNPNLQNIPSRDPILGPLLRSLFIPEDGCIWRRFDYSQIEYRCLVHFASAMNVKGAELMRQRYIESPDTDFHQMTIDMVKEFTGIILDRKPAKNINFGLVYGMGREKLIRTLGVSVDVGNRLYDAYFEALPAVADTLKQAQKLASRRGYIRTVMGRRKRFEDMEEGRYGGEQRAHTHKALNSSLQGSAADIMKAAMRACYEDGLFDVVGIPHLTVHDELDFSDEQTPQSAEAFTEIKHLLETATPLRIPLLVDVDAGATWGDCL
jgi:DNA polymerase I-like protein with 3'-5' exonuclease and polymerase domains